MGTARQKIVPVELFPNHFDVDGEVYKSVMKLPKAGRGVYLRELLLLGYSASQGRQPLGEQPGGGRRPVATTSQSQDGSRPTEAQSTTANPTRASSSSAQPRAAFKNLMKTVP